MGGAVVVGVVWRFLEKWHSSVNFQIFRADQKGLSDSIGCQEVLNGCWVLILGFGEF